MFKGKRNEVVKKKRLAGVGIGKGLVLHAF